MASTVSKKRLQRTTTKPRKPQHDLPFDEERIKQLMKQAVREVLEERDQKNALPPSQDTQPPPARMDPLQGKTREEIIELARQAEGSWREREGSGTSVEIVRRLRDEWKHRPQ